MPFSYRKWLAGSTGASCREKKSRKKRNCSAVSLPRNIDCNIYSVSEDGPSAVQGDTKPGKDIRNPGCGIYFSRKA